MEQVRDVVLDHACEALADIRGQKNALAADEKSAMGGALQRMQQRGTQAYKHAGIELVRVPGSDSLRVRLTKEQGDASVEGGETTSTHDDLTGAGEDDPGDDLSIQ